MGAACLAWSVELELLVPAACRRRSAMHALLLGARSSRQSRPFFLQDRQHHCAVLFGEDNIIVNPWAAPCPEFWGSWAV